MKIENCPSIHATSEWSEMAPLSYWKWGRKADRPITVPSNQSVPSPCKLHSLEVWGSIKFVLGKRDTLCQTLRPCALCWDFLMPWLLIDGGPRTTTLETHKPIQGVQKQGKSYFIFQLLLVPNWWMLLHFGYKSICGPTCIVHVGWWKENMWTLRWHLLDSLYVNSAHLPAEVDHTWFQKKKKFKCCLTQAWCQT